MLAALKRAAAGALFCFAGAAFAQAVEFAQVTPGGEAALTGAGDRGGDSRHDRGVVLQHILIGFRRQAAHEIQLHLAPTSTESCCNCADQIFFGNLLIDYFANTFAATFRGES